MKEFHWFKKFIPVFLLCLLLTSCTDTKPVLQPGNTASDPKGTLTMSYCKTDSMNPFLSVGDENRHLWPLLFLSLFEVDKNFQPQPVMADTYESTPTTVTLTLRSGQRTPDGTELSIADVLYSFKLAQQSAQYAKQLSVFASAAIGTKADVLVFTLNQPNQNACSLLTFPVVQYGTADNENSVPIGAGPYSLSKLTDGYCMLYNPYYYDGNPQSAQINLLDAGNDTARAFALESRSIDCSFSDLDDGKIIRSAASAHKISLNNLVYIGINFKNENLKNETLRQALSHVLDREMITEYAFCGYASATDRPFNPNWYALQEVSGSNNTTADVQNAIRLLGQTTVQQGTALNQTITLRLLYCTDNPFKTAAATQIKEQIEKTPLKVTLVGKEKEEYMTAVEKGDYDLFLGETILTADMNLNAFLSSSGSLLYATDLTALNCDETYAKYLNGETELSTFLTEFAEEVPFIPVCTRMGIFHTSRLLKNEVLYTPYNLYKNICYWEK